MRHALYGSVPPSRQSVRATARVILVGCGTALNRPSSSHTAKTVSRRSNTRRAHRADFYQIAVPNQAAITFEIGRLSLRMSEPSAPCVSATIFNYRQYCIDVSLTLGMIDTCRSEGCQASVDDLAIFCGTRQNSLPLIPWKRKTNTHDRWLLQAQVSPKDHRRAALYRP